MSSTIREVRAFCCRAPIAEPVKTSFGTMHDRPAVFVRVVDDTGRVGWGEAWCNFPSVGAEHRARLVDEVLAPLLIGRDAGDPAAVFEWLSERVAVLVLQCGEPGPFAQTIAAVDIALWDLAAQRASLPLWRLLGGTSPGIAVYASGINPGRPLDMVMRKQHEGHRAFKLKIGFGAETDVKNVREVRDHLGSDAVLAVDANQGWTQPEAISMAAALRVFGLAWLEEPMRADRPPAEWQALASRCGMPLAGGENIAGLAAFDAAIALGALGVIQPDLAKWGGISGCLPVARAARAAGRRVCPHYLGGGIGLLASAHLLAAVGGDGMLEIDSNPNPLRDSFAGAVGHVSEGRVTLDETPGLGSQINAAALSAFVVAH